MSLQSILTSVIAFASTNIDDIFILMLFYAGGRSRNSDIIIGQYVGIGALVVISLIGAYIGGFFDGRYVGILGLFPIYLGVRQAVGLFRKDHNEDASDVKVSGVFAVAGVTIANGADNLGVYIPLLTTMTITEKIVLVFVFAVATYAWCWIARYLSSRPMIAKHLDRYGHIITPIVLILLGVFILIESGTMSLVVG